MKKDLQQLRNREQTFFRILSNQHKNDLNSNKILYRGVVEEVDRIGNDNRVRNSVLVRLVNIDPSDTDFEAFRWYAPLFPIHIIAIPEIGEEVLIIFENDSDFINGYWIKRVSTKNKLTRTLIGEDIIDTVNSNESESEASYENIKYATNEDIKNKKDIDIEPDHEYNIPEDRNKPGDVVISGRSNTDIKQSFDSISKKGYIELVTERDTIDDNEFYKEDFNKTNGSRIITATQSDLDTKIIESDKLQFHEKFENKKQNVPYVLIESEQIRFISRKGGEINHAILGEIQEEWFKEAIDILKSYIDDVKNFVDDFIITEYLQHFHGTGVGPSTPTTVPGKASSIKSSLDSSSNKTKNSLDKLFEKVPNHRSKHIGIN